MSISPDFLPKAAPPTTEVVPPSTFNPAAAMDMRIGQLNNAVLGTAINLLPAAIGIGILIYGFRKVYQNTIGNIL